MGKLKNKPEAMEYPVEGNKSKNYENFLSDLAYKESSNRHFIVNECRFAGLYQIGAPAAGNSLYYNCKEGEKTWNPNGWKNYNKITKFEEFLGVKDGFDIEKAINGKRKENEKYQESMVSEKRKDNAIKAQTEMVMAYHKASWNEIVYNVTTYDEYKNMKELKTEKKYGKISEEIKRILGIGKDCVRNGVCCTHYNKVDKKTYKFKITQSGIIAALHLVGAGKVKPYLLTGEGSADGNGTRITEYMWRFADYDMTDLFNGKDIKYVPGSGANPEKTEAGSKSSGTVGTNGKSKKEGVSKGQDVKPDNVKHSTVKADNNTLYPDSASGKIVIRGFRPGDLKINIPRYEGADGKGVTKTQENQNNIIKESKIEYGTVTGKVVCDGAKIFCPAGGESVLKSSKQSFFKINGKNVILESEITSSNITKFKACAVEKNKKCNPIVKKNWDNTVEHLSTLKENVVTTFSQVVCLKGMLPIIIRDGNQQGVEYGATAKVTRTEGATADDSKADDKKKDIKEIKDAVAVNLEEKKSAVAKIDYTAVSGKLPIKKGEKGEIVREINIRLMGFGGGLPSDEYNDYTVKVVKQFKEDYMGLKNADGTFVDMATIQAIDKFADEYPITETEFNQMKCPCPSHEKKHVKCGGFGKGRKELTGKEVFKKYNKTVKDWQDTGDEAFNPHEYPGIHKGILWIFRASKFYLKKHEYYVAGISSGYRCWDNNKFHSRGSTNHMGKALDILVGKKGIILLGATNYAKIRKSVFIPEMNAQIRWRNKNTISLEPSGKGLANDWVHIDIRKYDSEYLKDEFFVKTEQEIKEPIKLKNMIK